MPPHLKNSPWIFLAQKVPKQTMKCWKVDNFCELELALQWSRGLSHFLQSSPPPPQTSPGLPKRKWDIRYRSIELKLNWLGNKFSLSKISNWIYSLKECVIGQVFAIFHWLERWPNRKYQRGTNCTEKSLTKCGRGIFRSHENQSIVPKMCHALSHKILNQNALFGVKKAR